MKTSTGIGFRTAISPVASNSWAISTFSPISSVPLTTSFPAILTPSPMYASCFAITSLPISQRFPIRASPLAQTYSRIVVDSPT